MVRSRRNNSIAFERRSAFATFALDFHGGGSIRQRRTNGGADEARWHFYASHSRSVGILGASWQRRWRGRGNESKNGNGSRSFRCRLRDVATDAWCRRNVHWVDVSVSEDDGGVGGCVALNTSTVLSAERSVCDTNRAGDGACDGLGGGARDKPGESGHEPMDEVGEPTRDGMFMRESTDPSFSTFILFFDSATSSDVPEIPVVVI